MDTKEAYDSYKLAKTNIFLESADLEELQVNKHTSELEGNYLKEISFGKRTEYIKENEIYGYLRVEVLCRKETSKEIDLEIVVIYRGKFIGTTKTEKVNLEDWTEIQIVPQLLPYARTLINFTTSQMLISPIVLPTMDILESIMNNRSKDLEGDE